ncbi:hypothetical protein F4604DRAFT_1878863 [Suillus subluteus]|nr:hypothetical protein F4604DRAFT_1878863 [Suillus subluteus]
MWVESYRNLPKNLWATSGKCVIPCSPISPTTAITMEALDFYRVTRQHNLHFSIQAYVRMLCDLQGVQFYPYLLHQFSIVLDVYLQILSNVDTLVHQAIRCCDPMWRLKHACPACTCTLKGEVPLKFSLLYTMDSNDSLKYEGQKMRKMWGMFDESGIFMSACHHGFSLLIADMVQSGEQSKYPLAVVSKLLDTFRKDLGGGYDIGCRFKTTLSWSSLGRHAHDLNNTSLVGAFHGHAHQRLCQLNHLTTYIDGLGLEDLEGCEQIFSKSNALVASVPIANYFQHNNNFEVYVNLTTFLYNNYKQALNMLHDAHSTLPKLMVKLGVTDKNAFDSWLAEEHSYLMSLTQEPEHEMLHMEYWQRLVNLSGSKNETAQRHAIENYNKGLKVVQELEEWRDAGRLVANCKLQCALDNLEGLVVARIFELSKMNQAGTGYKLQKHISKALQVCSAAICTALDRYNTAAHAVSPPQATLSWEDIVKYAFVADFDLLQDTWQDMCRACKEILRLNIEIHHIATYLCDKEFYLAECENQLQMMHPTLTHQVGLHRNICARFTAYHLRCLHEIRSITPGKSINEGPGAAAICIPAKLLPVGLTMMEGDEDEALEDLEEGEIADADGEEDSHILKDILQVAVDI